VNTASSAVARRTHWGEWLAWFIVLGIVTAGLLAIRARINEAHVALAYLIVVQAGSARRGRGLGIALAVASVMRSREAGDAPATSSAAPAPAVGAAAAV